MLWASRMHVAAMLCLLDDGQLRKYQTESVLPVEGGANIPEALRAGRCTRLDYQCEISTAVTVLVAAIVACFIG
jgi:hypothetical protein